jgi:putative transposase
MMRPNTTGRHRIERHQLTTDAGRGSSTASKPVAHLLADLGVTTSYSQPCCSNDNPYGEPVPHPEVPARLPGRFGSFEDAHGFCGDFFGWYNNEHRHSGIAFHVPADGHHGRADTIRAHRAEVLDEPPPPTRTLRPTPTDTGGATQGPRG